MACRPTAWRSVAASALHRTCSGQIDVVHFSPLQRALLQSAAALALRGLRATNVQHVFDHYPYQCHTEPFNTSGHAL